MNRCPACGGGHAAPDFRCPHCGFAPPLAGGVPLLAPALADAVAGFDPREFAALAAQEDGHFWFEGRSRILVDALRRHAPAPRDYLEVGCGTGHVLAAVAAAFPGLAITASEVLTEGLVHAARRVPSARLLQLDARVLPFEAAFDVIGAYDVLEHIVEDAAVLVAMHAALRPGGHVLLAVPQHPALWSAQDDVARHERRYRRGELEGRLRDAGFTIVASTSFMTLLLPAMWLSRRRATAAPPAAEVADAATGARATDDEMAPPRWANTVMGWTLALERRAIALGLALPVGGSRLVVAQRPPAAGAPA